MTTERPDEVAGFSQEWVAAYDGLVIQRFDEDMALQLLCLLERPEDLQNALVTFTEEVVRCECSPDVNPGCALGTHEHGHFVAAIWRIRDTNDPDDFFYACTPCKNSRADAGSAGLRFEIIEEVIERATDSGPASSEPEATS